MRLVLVVGVALLVVGWLLLSSEERGASVVVPGDAGHESKQAGSVLAASMLQADDAPRLSAAGQNPAGGGAQPAEAAVGRGRMRLLGTFRDEAGAVVRVRDVHAELERDGTREDLKLCGAQPAGNFDYWFPLVARGGTVRLRFFASNLVPVERSFAAVPGTVQRLSIVFVRGDSLRGKVVDSAGAPVAGMRVSVPLNEGIPSAQGHPIGRRTRVAITGTEGLFTLKGLENRLYSIHASLAGRSVAPHGLQRRAGLTEQRQVRPGDAPHTLVVRRSARMSGQILDAWSRRPVAGAHAQGRLTLSDGRVLVARSDAVDGLYQLSWTLPPACELGGSSLASEFSARGYETRTIRSDDDPTGVHDLLSVLLTPMEEPDVGSAWLEVVDAHGRPVDLDLRVTRTRQGGRKVIEPFGHVVPRQAVDVYGAPGRVQVVGKGRLRVRDLVGSFPLRIAPKLCVHGLFLSSGAGEGLTGATGAWEGVVTFARGAKQWTRIQLAPMALLEIPAGRPVALKGLRLSCKDPKGGALSAATNLGPLPKGRLRVAVAPGTWHVTWWGASAGTTQVLRLTAGKTTRLKLP